MANANEIKSGLSALIREVTGASRLTLGRNQMRTDAVTDQPLTLRDFDIVGYMDGDKEVSYAVCIFDEFPEGYYNAGAQLTEVCASIEAAGLAEQLRETGYKLALKSKTTKNGQSFTVVIPME